MTTKTQKTKRPTINLCSTYSSFGEDTIFNIGGMWEKKSKKGKPYYNMGFQNLFIKETHATGLDQVKFDVFVETWINGQSKLAQIGFIQPENENGLMAMKLLNLKAFKNQTSQS